MFGKVTRMAGANVINDKYEAKVDFKLYAVGNSSPQLASSESAKTGGGVSVMGALQGGMMFGSMFMGGFGGGGMGLTQMWMGQVQGMGMNMMMVHAFGGMDLGFGVLDKKEESVLSTALSQEAKAVVTGIQKR